MKIQTYKLLNVIFAILIIILLIYIISTNINKKSVADTIDNSVNKPTDDSSDTYNRLDTILKNFNYNYIYTYEKFSSIYLSTAEYDDNNFSITEHKVEKDGDSINITIKSKNSFLVSLPGYGTWSLNNANSLKNMTLVHTSTIVDWKNDKPDGYLGIVYGRDNFYFSLNSTGTETLQFKYPDGFTVNLNITIS